MTRNPVATMTEHFGRVEDPRIDRTKLHKLVDIIVIAICAAICGSDGWVGVETLGNSKLHWVLDVTFREDDCRIRKGYGAQNFAVLRHIALNLLKQEQTTKCGIKNKRLQAGWDEAYLFKVLTAMN